MTANAFQPVDLAAYRDEPHIWIEPGIVARGYWTLLHGEPAAGKTWLALAIAAGVIERGGRALLVDLESGPRLARRRVLALGLDMGGLTYLPEAPVTLDNAHDFIEFAANVVPDLVIFDSLANSLAIAGLQENDNTAVTQWVRAYPHQLTRSLGAAAIVIDHDVKSGSNGYARGAGAKKAQADFDFSMQVAQPFTRDRIGLVTLESRKRGGRTGDAADHAAFRLGGDGESFIYERLEEGQASTDGPLSNLESRILDAVTNSPDGVTHGDLQRAIPEPSEPTIRRARQQLVNRGLIVPRGEGRGTRYLPAEAGPNG